MTTVDPVHPWGSLAELAADASTCTKCPLAETRTQVVFGAGSPDADLVFVGEGPGAEEDLQGSPSSAGPASSSRGSSTASGSPATTSTSATS